MRRWNGMKIGSVLSAGVVTVGLLAGCRDILGIVPLGGDGTGGSAATGSTGGSGGTSTSDAAGSSSGGSGSGGNGSIPFWQIGGPGEDIGNDIATVGQAVVMVGSSTDTIDKGFSEISIKQAAQDAIVVGCSTEGAATECTLHQRIGSLATKQSAQSVTIQPGTGAIYVGGMFEGKAAQPVVDKCPSNCSSSMPVQDDGVFLEHLSSSGGCVCADTMGINLVRDPQTIAIDSDATGVTTVALRSSETTSGSILGCAPATAPKTAPFVARSTGDNTCTTVKNMIATGYAQQAPRIALDDQGAAFVAVSFPYDIGPEPENDAGCPVLDPIPPSDTFVEKIVGDACTWRTALADAGSTHEVQLAITKTGAVAVAGAHDANTTVGGCEIAGGVAGSFISIVSSDGIVSCGYSLVSGDTHEVTDIAIHDDGNVVIVGSFKGSVAVAGTGIEAQGAGWDVFVLKVMFDGSSDPQIDSPDEWVRALHNTGDLKASAVAIDESNNIYVTGSFTGSVDFGNGPVTSQGGSDAFIVKLSP